MGWGVRVGGRGSSKVRQQERVGRLGRLGNRDEGSRR